jgi:hypothetical protein
MLVREKNRDMQAGAPGSTAQRSVLFLSLFDIAGY